MAFVFLIRKNGAQKLVDQIEDNFETQTRAEVDSFLWPVGIYTQPYYQFDSGLGIGGGIGPAVVVFGDVSVFALPLNASLRFRLPMTDDVGPYVRGRVILSKALALVLSGRWAWNSCRLAESD